MLVSRTEEESGSGFNNVTACVQEDERQAVGWGSAYGGRDVQRVGGGREVDIKVNIS